MKVAAYLSPANVLFQDPQLKPWTWTTIIMSISFVLCSGGYAIWAIVRYSNMEPDLFTDVVIPSATVSEGFHLYSFASQL